jgi:hypothetical protein
VRRLTVVVFLLLKHAVSYRVWRARVPIGVPTRPTRSKIWLCRAQWIHGTVVSKTRSRGFESSLPRWLDRPKVARLQGSFFWRELWDYRRTGRLAASGPALMRRWAESE